MGARITIIAPFPDLQRTAEKVAKERADEWPDGIDVVLGDLAAGVTAARQAMDRGTEVIVSRGGTARLIADRVETPVVEIQVTAFDILRALSQVGGSSGTVGVVGFRNVVYGCEDIGRHLGMTLREITLENEAEGKEKIAAAFREGIRVMIGDAISVKLAVSFGMEGFLIQSGKEAIYRAIKEAELVARVRRKEQERSELLRTVIDSSTDGIIAVDERSQITIFNPMAEEIFQMPASQVLGRPVKDVIPNTSLPKVIAGGMVEIGEIQHIGNKVIITKHFPIKLNGKVVGAIASFQDVTQLQRFEQIVRQKLYAKGLVAKVTIDQVIGCSAALEAVKNRARQYAATDSTVLITGESGTGKEMMAQSIHNLSKRRKGPFVAINCAALPEHLLESELFGYDEGAFTGAKKGGKAGLFELAHGGTLFLDEISEMPLPLQARLLRVLQEREVMRLGGDRVIPVDVRVIAATNQDLPGMIAEKKFRNDLYYRLDILRLQVPPLRDRSGDVPLLARHFLSNFYHLNHKVSGISEGALRLLQLYPWHGNVRELANILQRTILLARGPVITEEDIQEALPPNHLPPDGHAAPAGGSLADIENSAIERVLAEERFNYTRAAARLGINRSTLWRKLNKRR